MGYIADFRGTAASRGQWPALMRGDVTMSYAVLADRIRGVAAALGARGIGAGHVVGVSIEDEIEHMVATLAVLTVGASQVTLAVFDPEPLRAKIASIASVTHILATDDAFALPGLPFTAWAEIGRGAPPTALADTGGAILLRTSGTTGGIKMIALDDRRLALQARDASEGYRQSRQLRVVSVEHNVAKRHALYILWAGGTVVFRLPRSASIDLDYCAEMGVTILEMGYVQGVSLLSARRPAPPSLEVRLSGSTIPASLRRGIRERLGCAVTVRYGATECGSTTQTRPDPDEDETVGRLLPNVDLQIVDEAGTPLPPGEFGEIRLKTPGMADGYIGAPEDTAQRFRDGWFWPGDMGRRLPGGHVVVSGRRDDMIIMSSINIFPAEIEAVLNTHPAVRNSLALGLPSPTFGHIPVAAVELHQGAQVSERDLQAFARGILALRTPRRIMILDQLPRDAIGKLRRRDVARAFETQRTAK